MKAQVLHAIGDIRYEDVNMPEVAPGEVLVKVANVGICGSDIPRVYQTGAHRMPLIPGHEFSGVVADTGRRVGIFPLIPCMECEPCRKGYYEMCRNYSYLGSRRDGGFAEYVAVPEKNLLPLPESVSLEQAAMLEPMAVAVHAMRGALGIEKPRTIAVCGLGTIGLFLIMFLKEAGFEKVFAIGNKKLQHDKALELGIAEDQYCNSREVDAKAWLMEKTGGYGVDVFFECVGRGDTAELAIDAAAPAGTVMMVGNPYGDMTFSRDVYWKILRHQLTVRGTWNSSFTGDKTDDWHYVLERLAEGRIHPEKMISHRVELEDLEQGLLIMRDKTEEYVKVMARV